MVELKAKPYNLSDEDIKWVEDTIASLSDEEKVGQLFFQLTQSKEEDYIKDLLGKYHLGGLRYNPGRPDELQNQNRYIQKYSKVPAFIACNTEKVAMVLHLVEQKSVQVLRLVLQEIKNTLVL